jgi:hypothetical protein
MARNLSDFILPSSIGKPRYFGSKDIRLAPNVAPFIKHNVINLGNFSINLIQKRLKTSLWPHICARVI